MSPSPAHRPTVVLSEILRHIRWRQRIGVVSAIGLVLLGAPIVLIGPLVMGTIFWFVAFNLWGTYPWSWFFWAVTLLMVPAMLWGEAKLRGGAFAEANPDISPGDADGNSLSPLPLLAWGHFGLLVGVAANPRLAASGLVEFFLAGPRLLLDGLTKLRRSWQLRNVAPLRAAEIVADLNVAGAAVPVETLLRGGEQVERLVPVLCLLLFQEWIGISRTGYQVWLLSSARETLSHF